MNLFPLKASHRSVKAYYEALATFTKHGHSTEGNTRSAFSDLLKKCGPSYGWHLVEEYQFKGTNKQPLRADGALVDDLTLVHGIWEAKDSDDDLPKEIRTKRDRGYPLTNIIFQSPGYAVLYQGGRIAFEGPITDPEKLMEALELFFEHRQEHEVDWEDAVVKFAEKIPELARGVTDILAKEYSKNATFRDNFKSFSELCRQSINPDLTDDAIRKMLVQHLLTERIFRKVFNNQEFLARNIIAAEIEKVIRSITARHFSRDEFLKPLDRFYSAIERAAESQTGYTEKQHFLNAVYEKFFQRFDTKQADTHGIVYTPQPIVDFMVRAIEEILSAEFDKSLSEEGVHILDPFTGTGNFVTRIMQQIKRSALEHKYAHELHCNEIMLLPYYIASMNIEHAYMERFGEYRPFEGICLVDTFELAEARQRGLGFMSEANTDRVEHQKTQEIFVVTGNPPYNAAQDVENDNNKNRRHPNLHKRVWGSYASGSKATLLNTLNDPYIQAFRWATDRLEGRAGIVAFVTNSGFLAGKATDGMRRSLAREYDKLFIVDLGGDVRSNPSLSGTTHNVFGIQAGVAITILVRTAAVGTESGSAAIKVFATDPLAKRQAKLDILQTLSTQSGVWKDVHVPEDGRWLVNAEDEGYADLLEIASQAAKKQTSDDPHTIFKTFTNGAKTNRDRWAFNFDASVLEENIQKSIRFYNSEVDRLPTEIPKKFDVDKFVTTDDLQLSWSGDLKMSLLGRHKAHFDESKIRDAMYRPFTAQHMFFDRVLNNRVYLLPSTFGLSGELLENVMIGVTTHLQVAFSVLATDKIPSLDFGGRPTQFFPFYTYSTDGTVRRENITDWSLAEFRAHYGDKSITKWDIFNVIYAVLHHPEYRVRFSAELQRDFPRVPFPPDIHAFARVGKEIMTLHLQYEKQKGYRLEQVEDEESEITYRVERMKLSKDKTQLQYNDFITLKGIPLEVYEYRIGNRSALEWVIDQYRVSSDERFGTTNDPNRPEDPQYILRLVKQIVQVSLDTMTAIKSLPALEMAAKKRLR
jgi:predicted helicase